MSRSKLVPDFAFTVHILHLVVTSLYVRALPTNLLWWALQACSVGLMTSLGIWACRWRELQPISFGGNGIGKAIANGAATGTARRAAEGAGPSYEMVPVKEGEGEV